MTFFRSPVEGDSNRRKLQYVVFTLAVFVVVYFALFLAMQGFKIPIPLFGIAAIVLAYLARGEKIIDDLVVFFPSGTVPAAVIGYEAHRLAPIPAAKLAVQFVISAKFSV